MDLGAWVRRAEIIDGIGERGQPSRSVVGFDCVVLDVEDGDGDDQEAVVSLLEDGAHPLDRRVDAVLGPGGGSVNGRPSLAIALGDRQQCRPDRGRLVALVSRGEEHGRAGSALWARIGHMSSWRADGKSGRPRADTGSWSATGPGRSSGPSPARTVRRAS